MAQQESSTSSQGLTGMDKAQIGADIIGGVGQGVGAWYAAKKAEEQQKRELQMEAQKLNEQKRQFNVSTLMSMRKMRMDERMAKQQLEAGQLEIENAKGKVRSHQATLSAISRRLGGTNA